MDNRVTEIKANPPPEKPDFEIANKRKFKLIDHLDVIEKLIKAGYIKKK